MAKVLSGNSLGRFAVQAGCIVMALLFLIYTFASISGAGKPLPAVAVQKPHSSTTPAVVDAPKTPVQHTTTTFTPPAGTKIHGLVFYGRWDRVQILDCYLKQNLKSHGGLLDKVIFVSNTADAGDLEALERILASTPDYVRGATLDPGDDKLDFHNIWAGLDADTLYIKIDDDTVYIAPSAVESLVKTRLAHPEHYITSANVVNNPALSWVHTRLGAMHAFLPETSAPEGFKPTAAVKEWRMSKLRAADGASEPPTTPHRWLPVKGAKNLDGTPVRKAKYDPWGPGWNDWTLAAQEHYSFFANMEAGEEGVGRYRFGTWDMNYERLSINFIAVWGRDVHTAMPIPRDDEQHLTQDMSKKLGRHVVVDGGALVAHYSFGAQKEGLVLTDVLERYRALAREVCGVLME